jgi:Flp pilus assembly pilin Flp
MDVLAGLMTRLVVSTTVGVVDTIFGCFRGLGGEPSGR